MESFPLHRDDVNPRTDYTYGCRCPRATNARRIHQSYWYAGYRKTMPYVGAQRRLRALACMGWSLTNLAERSTLSRNGLKRIRVGYNKSMFPDSWKEVARLYEELCDVQGPSSRARTDAIKYKWNRPEAWEDIDDPACEPHTVSKGNSLSIVDRMSEYMHLVQCGMSEYEARKKLDLLDNTKFGIYMARYRKAQEAA